MVYREWLSGCRGIRVEMIPFLDLMSWPLRSLLLVRQSVSTMISVLVVVRIRIFVDFQRHPDDIEPKLNWMLGNAGNNCMKLI